MTLLGATNLIRDELGDEPEVLRLASFCTDKAVEDPSAFVYIHTVHGMGYRFEPLTKGVAAEETVRR